MTNTIQQRSYISEDKEEAPTEAETFVAVELHSPIDLLIQSLPQIAEGLDRHHDITGKISQGTFTSDKILRLLSAFLKCGRNFNLFENLKGLEKFGSEIGQLRRLLRCDRLLMILREYTAFYKKERLSKVDKFMVLFKAMILFGDANDILAYLLHLRVLKNEKIIPSLKRNVANIYFLECIGWLIYHSYEYIRSKDEESRYKNKMMMIKYVLDTFTSHNDFSQRLFTANPKIISTIGFISSLLNLYLVWK